MNKNSNIKILYCCFLREFLQIFYDSETISSETYYVFSIIELDFETFITNNIKMPDNSKLAPIRENYIINSIELLDIIDLNEKPSKEYMLEDKDIIFVRSNGSKELVGRSTLIDGVRDEITYSGFCIRYRNNTEELNTRYLIELFQNKEFFDYLKKDSRGANINNINQQMLSNLKIILPPIELQNKFADFVKQIDKQKFEIENSLKEMQELYESLMEKYFG